MSNPRVATCIFCDDIRAELSNKISLIGIYGSDMLIASPLPALIGRFGVAVFLITDIGDEPDHLSITIMMHPEETVLIKAEANKPPQTEDVEEGDTKRQLRAMFSLPAFTVTQEGYIEVRVDTGRETLRAGKLLLKSASQSNNIQPVS
jgi:uncharacterized protein DUF6941